MPTTSKPKAAENLSPTAAKALTAEAQTEKVSAAKKPAAKKPAAKKEAAKKAAAVKKPTAKKAAAVKKSVAQESAAKKPAADKAVSPRAKKAPAAKVPAAALATVTGADTAADSSDDGSDTSRSEVMLAEARALLLAERATYTEQAQVLKAEADLLVQEAEPGDIQFDEESGEGGTMTVDRERDLALAGQARAAVEEIDHALAKVEAGTYGTYGTCERCHQRIPQQRLKALPYARLCVACKSGGLSRR